MLPAAVIAALVSTHSAEKLMVVLSALKAHAQPDAQVQPELQISAARLQ